MKGIQVSMVVLFDYRELINVCRCGYTDLPEKKKWTLKHGYLLEMGGLTLVDPTDRDTLVDPTDRDAEFGVVLTFDYLRHPNIDIPEITVADIEDRSKSDTFGKTIAIFQTAWFLLHCIARFQQRLALSELELVTFALTSINRVTYVISWQKPLGVKEPIRIPLRTERQIVRVEYDAARQLEVSVLHYSLKII